MRIHPTRFAGFYGVRGMTYDRQDPATVHLLPWENRDSLEKVEKRVVEEANRRGLKIVTRIDEFPMMDEHGSFNKILQGLLVFTHHDADAYHNLLSRVEKWMSVFIQAEQGKPKEAEKEVEEIIAKDPSFFEDLENETNENYDKMQHALQSTWITAESCSDPSKPLPFDVETGEPLSSSKS